jgi:DNA-binding NarL/FixJ family response regulator
MCAWPAARARAVSVDRVGIHLAGLPCVRSSSSNESSSARAPSIIVLSERAIFRDCVAGFLRHAGFPRTIGARPHGSDGADAADLLLVDLGQMEGDIAPLLRHFHECRPHGTVVAIGTPMQLAAQAAEADGWIELSDPAERLSAIAKSVADHPGDRLKLAAPPEVRLQLRKWRSLTPRQRQVLALLGCGTDNGSLAKALGISERAVKAHVSALLERFGAQNRTQLALVACRAGMSCIGQPGLANAA